MIYVNIVILMIIIIIFHLELSIGSKDDAKKEKGI